MTLNRTIVTAIAVVAALGLAGCSQNVDSDDLEGQLSDQFGSQVGNADVSTECPDDEAADDGNEFTCTITDEKRKRTFDVEVTLTDGGDAFEARILPPDKTNNGG